MPIYQTTIKVEVFSRDSYDLTDLSRVEYDITEGDCIGGISVGSSSVVPENELIGHLLRIGNDGTFFGDIGEEDLPDESEP